MSQTKPYGTLCNLTHFSEKARNPKEKRSELGMKVRAGKEVFSPPGDWVILLYDAVQFTVQRKMRSPWHRDPGPPLLHLREQGIA